MGSGLQNFHRNFQVNVTCFPFFPGLIKLIKRFSYDLEMKTRRQNRNDKRTEIE